MVTQPVHTKRSPVSYLWALPNTCLGLLFVPVAKIDGGQVRVVDGVVEIHSEVIAAILRRWVPLSRGALAITLGHVILGRDLGVLQRCRSHEHVHVRQYERWGPFFLPAYFFSSALAALRKQDMYRDNMFEKQAFAEEDPAPK